VKFFPKVDYKKIPLFKDVGENDWNDWHWQLNNVIRDAQSLSQVIELNDDEVKDLERCLVRFRMAITPYYASLMDPDYELCSVRLQAVPSLKELEDNVEDMDDPLKEDIDSPTPSLTHRYPDRVLFLVTNRCTMYCRHCTRRRMVGFDDKHRSTKDLELSLDYIRTHPEIRDVLISGGDPLIMSNDRLELVLSKLREIDHVDIIRLGSRVPVVLPQRITGELVSMLKKYHPIYLNTHFNHYKEITAESKAACERLTDAGISVGNQTVLLRDINDCPRIMKKLMQDLLSIRVKPYYIYQCDLSRGITHFRTSISKGIEIIENLRGHTSGMAVPTFVVDAPGGGGKIPLMPEYILSHSDKRVILRNFEGVITTYTQPENIYSDCWCELCRKSLYGPEDGVAKLLLGEKVCLDPVGLKRTGRRNGDKEKKENKAV